MNDMQMEMWDALCELSGEEVARLFTCYHGTCLLSEGWAFTKVWSPPSRKRATGWKGW